MLLISQNEWSFNIVFDWVSCLSGQRCWKYEEMIKWKENSSAEKWEREYVRFKMAWCNDVLLLIVTCCYSGWLSNRSSISLLVSLCLPHITTQSHLTESSVVRRFCFHTYILSVMTKGGVSYWVICVCFAWMLLGLRWLIGIIISTS